jgi:hypothetical protein
MIGHINFLLTKLNKIKYSSKFHIFVYKKVILYYENYTFKFKNFIILKQNCET